MLNYELLETLEAVVSQASFIRAARHLKVTQSAISQRIRMLEELSGQPLLSSRTPPRLTRRGEELISHLRKVRVLEADLEDAPSGDSSRVRTRVRIGINADSLATWLLDSLTPVAHERNLLFDMIVENEELSYRLLEQGDVIGCISARGHAVPGGELVPLGRMTYIGVATPSFMRKFFSNGTTRRAIEDAPSILFDLNDVIHERFLRKALGMRKVSFPFHTVPTSHGFLDSIVKGLAYGVPPALQAEPLLKTGQLVRVFPACSLDVPFY